MPDKYIFFCCKYSDLDNMIPVLFSILEANECAEAVIYWYGKTVKDDSSCLLRFAQDTYAERLSIIVPFRKEYSSYNSVNLAQRFFKQARQLWNRFKGFPSETWLASQAGEYVLHHSNGGMQICFFGFDDREFLRRMAELTNNHNTLWVRLPQGVRLTVSAFRNVNSVTAPHFDSVNNYFPEWADAAIDVDNAVYKHYAEVYGQLGIYQPRKQVAMLGAPRFSHRWIRRLDEIFSGIVTAFSAAPVNQRRILFLLTSWQKNVWREEVLRVLDIVNSYNVFIVVKGFHANTSQEIFKKGVCIDEDSPTSALIRDADAVIYIATSAALEGYMRGKEMLQLSYLHGNQTSLEKNGVGIAAQCRDDVHLRMQQLVQTSSLLFDGEEEKKVEAERFVHDEIVGENPMRDYVDYLFELIEERRKSEN